MHSIIIRPDGGRLLVLFPYSPERVAKIKTIKYKKLNFFEQYAMYMGMAQLHEISLKRLLSARFNYDLDDLEKWTMGRVANADGERIDACERA